MLATLTRSCGCHMRASAWRAKLHVSLVPVVGSVGEQKSKPTQASVRDLRGLGLMPDVVRARGGDLNSVGLRPMRTLNWAWRLRSARVAAAAVPLQHRGRAVTQKQDCHVLPC